ncbi:MAG: NAD synthetase [Candidatus Saccharicenans subterraneus]|uniref:NH(3)-dependent NAD(+) synthetase n=1 Tax=Candidatus Saccharicenans subterraneus TaxID=2508984 RepID=A0A3E2BLU5_9BACT|nr:MAG: NAD synthetase [Candidatus Saccharicenans subterraneum]
MPGKEHMNEFSYDVLKLDYEKETARLTAFISEAVARRLRKHGAVVGISGGIDSSVTAALCVRALGPDKVVGLLMPEKDSHPDTLKLSRLVGESLGIRTIHREITPILAGLGFYDEMTSCIQELIPEYADGWKWKISASDVSEERIFSFFWLVVQSPRGEIIRKRLPADRLLHMIALSNFKQRTRKMLEYHYADRFNYAVAGTSNLLESDQGFFVKLGDGAGDFKPIAHLYKMQIYQLGKYLGLPEAITQRKPTADIHPLSQGQDEFFFGLPYEQLDACLYGEKNGIPAESVARVIGLDADRVSLIYRQLAHRRITNEYLSLPPLYPER